MAFLGLTGNRRELCVLLLTRRPRRHHGFQFLIVLFSILVPPLAVFIRFGIGKDFFINVILSILGYIPGHRVRRNESKERNPIWVERYKLTDPNRRARIESGRRWAERYTGYSRPVQYDEDGNEIYLDEEDELFDLPPALAARQRLQRMRTGEAPPEPQSELVEQEDFYNRDPAPAYSSPWRELPAEHSGACWTEEAAQRKDRSLKARTLKMLGARGGGGDTFSNTYAGTATGTSSAPSASAAGMDDLDRELMGLSTRDEPAGTPHAPPPMPLSRLSMDEELLEVQATGPGMDAMDRELMGMHNVEPIRTTPPRRNSARRPEPVGPFDNLDRDVLDVDHTF